MEEESRKRQEDAERWKQPGRGELWLCVTQLSLEQMDRPVAAMEK